MKKQTLADAKRQRPSRKPYKQAKLTCFGSITNVTQKSGNYYDGSSSNKQEKSNIIENIQKKIK